MSRIFNLGIIGAENSHSWSIARVCNQLQRVPLRVTHIWGETAELAARAAERGTIPHVVDDWRTLAGSVDGIMIDHRNGEDHFLPARFFLEHGVPTFVDKPFTCDMGQAAELLALARTKAVPLITFTGKPLQQSFRRFARNLADAGGVLAVNSSGPVDLESPYGGMYFYGIHQVDSIVELMGTGVSQASLTRCGENGVGSLSFADGRMATLNFLKSGGIFHWRACTPNGIFCLEDNDDEPPYLSTAETLADFFHTGKNPWSAERMLAPVAIMDALRRSLTSGRVETVGS